MQHSNIAKQAVLFMLFFFSMFSISAQQKSFDKLSHDEKRVVFYQWVNNSVDNVIPIEFEKEIQLFYSNTIVGENTYKKYKGFFKPIFNTQIQVSDRINYLTFLLSFISNEEMPLDVLRNEKKKLYTLLTR